MVNGIIFVQITTWKGISIGADHYYVKVCYYDENKEYQTKRLEDKLTAYHAKLLNKREFNYAEGYRSYHKKGDKTDGFWSEQDAKKKALKWIAEKFPDNIIVLTGGSSGQASVSECIKHPDLKKKNRINILWKKAERMGYYNKPENDSLMEKIDSEFTELIKIK